MFFNFNSFVKGLLTHYYKNNAEVQKDSELQKWLQDINVHGFLSQQDTGKLEQKAVLR